MQLLVENLQDGGLRGPVLDVVVDGECDALDGVLEVGLRDGGVVDEDGGAGAGLLELAERLGGGELQLALLARHAV